MRGEMMEEIRRCRFCRREMFASPLAYHENPFCSLCLNERTAFATTGLGPPVFEERDGYVETTRTAPQTPSSSVQTPGSA